MSGAPAGDLEDSGEFEQSQSEPPPAQRTAGSYEDAFEGEATEPVSDGGAAGPDRTYSEGFEDDESGDAAANAARSTPPAATRAEPGEPAAGGGDVAAPTPPLAAGPETATAEEPGELQPPASTPAAGAPPAEAPATEPSPREAPPPAEADPAEATAELPGTTPEPATAEAKEAPAAEEALSAEVVPAATADEDTQGSTPPPKEASGDPEQDDGEDTNQLLAEAENMLQTSPVAKDATATGSPITPRTEGARQLKQPKRKDDCSMSRSASGPSVVFGDFADIKRRTEAFGGMSTEGVKKGQTYATHIAGFKSSPKFTMTGRDKNPSFLRSNSVPAPGAYEANGSERSKYTNQPNFTFGGEKRFGAEKNPMKRQPGPGQYSPKISVETAPKIGFGSSMRLKGAMIAQSNPGPGAYETRSCLGEGLNYTARGRIPVHYMAAKSLPGPGAYNPTVLNIGMSGPRTGFGTSRRNQHGVLRELGPGPGSYELQNLKTLGTEGPKTSMTSRRRQHDINSYLTPGPGSYNSHATCFGGP